MSLVLEVLLVSELSLMVMVRHDQVLLLMLDRCDDRRWSGRGRG
jgi:hypothetical protein